MALVRRKQLLSRTRSQNTRKYLEEFNLLLINHSKEVKKFVRSMGEDRFFQEIDLWDFESESGGTINIGKEEFWFSIIGIQDDGAAEITHIVDIAFMSEEQKRLEMDADMESFMAEGWIEIE